MKWLVQLIEVFFTKLDGDDDAMLARLREQESKRKK